MRPEPSTDRLAVLLNLAAEAILPVLDGCARILAGTSMANAAPSAEKAAAFFGRPIAARWHEWLGSQSADARQAALEELAALSPDEGRCQAAAALERLASEALPDDRAVALGYLASMPHTLDQALLGEGPTGDWASVTAAWKDPGDLLALLPADAPPYPVPFDLPGTAYRLEQVLGAGGFGAVYRATARSLQHLPLAVKFCLDPSLTVALHQERSNLERLMKAGGAGWSPHVVRLYGYDFEHATPYLVYEYVAGGDLLHYLRRRRQQTSRPLAADEVLQMVIQMADGLAFAHRHGLVHRDLKPANVLVDGDTLKLGDFGLGSASAARAARDSHLGGTTDGQSRLSSASLFRGAGTPLYMSPEQRRGAAPDPRHDLFSLGVVWYQLLADDFRRELHPGWARELTTHFSAPRHHIELIERCVGLIEERPRDSGVLLTILRASLEEKRPAIGKKGIEGNRPTPLAPGEQRKKRQLEQMKLLSDAHEAVARGKQHFSPFLRTLPWAGLAFAAIFLLGSPLLSFLADAVEREMRWGLSRIWPPLLAAGAGLVAVAVIARHFYLASIHDFAIREQHLADQIEWMSRDFPEAVASWGGAELLRDRMVVAGLLRQLRRNPADDFAPRPPWADPETLLAGLADGPPRKELAAQLRGLQQCHIRASDRSRWPGTGQILFLGLLIGAVVGYLSGEWFFMLKFPQHGFMNAFGAVPFDWSSILAGVAAGFLTLLAVVIGRTRMWEWHLAQAQRAVRRKAAVLEGSFPLQVRAWGGSGVLKDPGTVTRLLHAVEAHKG